MNTRRSIFRSASEDEMKLRKDDVILGGCPDSMVFDGNGRTDEE